MKVDIRNNIIKQGVKNLKEFGYNEVNTENILTDFTYSQFFRKMLIENLGVANSIDSVISELISEIDEAGN